MMMDSGFSVGQFVIDKKWLVISSRLVDGQPLFQYQQGSDSRSPSHITTQALTAMLGLFIA